MARFAVFCLIFFGLIVFCLRNCFLFNCFLFVCVFPSGASGELVQLRWGAVGAIRGHEEQGRLREDRVRHPQQVDSLYQRCLRFASAAVARGVDSCFRFNQDLVVAEHGRRLPPWLRHDQLMVFFFSIAGDRSPGIYTPFFQSVELTSAVLFSGCSSLVVPV